MRNTYAAAREVAVRLRQRLRSLTRYLPFSATLTEDSSLRWLRAVMRASIIIPSVVLVIAAVDIYLDADREANERTDRDVRIVQEHALKILETASTVAGRVDDLIAADPAIVARVNELALHQKLADIATGMPQILSAWVTDADGNIIASDRYYPVRPGASIAARPYFQIQKAEGKPLVLSGAQRGTLSGQDYFALSRRWQANDGSFLGVIVVALSQSYFADYYRSIADTHNDLAVSLVREDGMTLVSFPGQSPHITKYAANSSIMQSIRNGGSARNEVLSGLDGMPRYVAVRKVGLYPVYVVAGTLQATVLQQWRARMAVVAGFILPATIALVLLCWTALRKVGREYTAVAQWREEMSRRITAEEALLRAQKMDAIGQMTGGVAHDFNNMLQIISSNVHIIRLKLPNAGVDAQLAAIDRARLSGESLTRQLLAFSRQQALRPEPIDLAQRMPTICALIYHSLTHEVLLDCVTEPGTWPIEVDPSQLDMAIFNLAINARDAMPNGGNITIRVRNVSADERAAASADLRGDFVAIAISDTGHGVPPEIGERIFEPFFTTKSVGKGTGLGLSQVFGFATQSGGTLKLKSKPGEGTTLTIYLPRAHRQSMPKASTDRMEANYRTEGRLLVVEDNEEVGNGLAQLLGEVGFVVTLVRSAADAVEILAHDDGFDLLLTDLVMPGKMNGLQLARKVLQEHPQIPIILMTGYSAEVRKASAEGFTILIKPFQMTALVAAIRERVGERAESGAESRKAGLETEPGSLHTEQT